MTENKGHKPTWTVEEQSANKRLAPGLVQGVEPGMVKVGITVECDDWLEVSTEWLWAEPVGDQEPLQAVLLNIPAHVDGVSHSDTVLMRRDEQDPPGFYRFAGVTKLGGHSTVAILTPPESGAFAQRWPRLEAHGCHYEKGEGETRFGRMMNHSVDVPPEADIGAVIAILEEGARDRVWMFRPTNIEHRAWPRPTDKRIREHRIMRPGTSPTD